MISHSRAGRGGEEADTAGDGHFAVTSRPSSVCKAEVLLQALKELLVLRSVEEEPRFENYVLKSMRNKSLFWEPEGIAVINQSDAMSYELLWRTNIVLCLEPGPIAPALNLPRALVGLQGSGSRFKCRLILKVSSTGLYASEDRGCSLASRGARPRVSDSGVHCSRTSVLHTVAIRSVPRPALPGAFCHRRKRLQQQPPEGTEGHQPP
jgi:hypothetical protein